MSLEEDDAEFRPKRLGTVEMLTVNVVPLGPTAWTIKFARCEIGEMGLSVWKVLDHSRS